MTGRSLSRRLRMTAAMLALVTCVPQGTEVRGVAASSPDPAVGPLTSSLAQSSGAVSLAHPESRPARWRGTFGDLLCTVGRDVELTSIDYEASVEPTSIRFLLRTGTVGEDVPIISHLGSARGLSGTKLPAPGGMVVRGCKQDRKFHELLTVVRASRAGAVIDNLTINYTVGGNTYSQPTHWVFTLCDAADRLESC